MYNLDYESPKSAGFEKKIIEQTETDKTDKSSKQPIFIIVCPATGSNDLLV